MPNLGPWEIMAILVVIVLLFGAKKLPDAARSLGRSMRIFKSEVKEMRNDDEQPQAIQQAPQAQPQSYWDQQAQQAVSPQQPQAQPMQQPQAQQPVQPAQPIQQSQQDQNPGSGQPQQ